MGSLWFDEMADDGGYNFVEEALMESDDEDIHPKHGGSRPGRAPNIDRKRHLGSIQLHMDYFATDSTYDEQHFIRRFRVTKNIFHLVANALEVHDPYFTQRTDCTGRPGFTCTQKCTAALRMIAYGCAGDQVDEYVRMGESTALACLERFSEGVVECFGDIYLREPSTDELKQVINRCAAKGFPGMMGSIDCAKWLWKNCPTALKGQYVGKEGDAAVTLECIADDELYIWHLFFGMPGCANDLNVLDASSLLNKIASGTYPPSVQYEIAGETRDKPYWLADGIYPRWPCFVQTYSQPITKKESYMAIAQESRRKDAERAFGVLQAKFHIISRPSRFWWLRSMHSIMKCCVILHNMMVRERLASEDGIDSIGAAMTDSSIVVGNGSLMWHSNIDMEGTQPPLGSIAALCGVTRFTEDETEYFKTKKLVTNHLWTLRGDLST